VIQKSILGLKLTSFPSLCILQNAMLATLRIICGYSRHSERTEFESSFSFKRPGSIRSFFKLSSDSKNQLSFVADELVCVVCKVSLCQFLNKDISHREQRFRMFRSPRKTSVSNSVLNDVSRLTRQGKFVYSKYTTKQNCHLRYLTRKTSSAVSKLQSMSSQTVLLRTTSTWTIIFHRIQ